MVKNFGQKMWSNVLVHTLIRGNSFPNFEENLHNSMGIQRKEGNNMKDLIKTINLTALKWELFNM